MDVLRTRMAQGLKGPIHCLKATLFAVGLLLVACAPSKGLLLEQSLNSYHSAIRWGSMDEALALIDPSYLAENPISQIDWQRYKQIRIIGYRPGSALPLPDGGIEQRVEIEFVNLHTQTTRSITDVQRWRYDETEHRWWLSTGLPRLH